MSHAQCPCAARHYGVLSDQIKAILQRTGARIASDLCEIYAEFGWVRDRQTIRLRERSDAADTPLIVGNICPGFC
jgi:hypothetical protein